MKRVYSILFIIAALVSGSASAATIKASVNGMVCAFCAQGIEKKLRANSATQDVYVSLENKVVAIALKSGQTMTDDTVKQVITDAGYAVTEIKHSEETLDAIRQAMKKK
jgi:copper chaperone CopZ